MVFVYAIVRRKSVRDAPEALGNLKVNVCAIAQELDTGVLEVREKIKKVCVLNINQYKHILYY
jgi:hypothetical protein